MDDMETVQDVKDNLICIAVSIEKTLTVKSLSNAYLFSFGVPVPYGKFGYSDLGTFMRENCEDSFLFYGPRSNPKIILNVQQEQMDLLDLSTTSASSQGWDQPGPSSAARAAPASCSPSLLAPYTDSEDESLDKEDDDPNVLFNFPGIIPVVDIDDSNVGDTFVAQVTEVYTPSHMWVHRLGDGWEELADIVKDMNDYYPGEGYTRVVREGDMRAGLYVACKYEGAWRRAVVVRLMGGGLVRVRYIDYGTVREVEARWLRPLLRRYAHLPAQAIRARLAGVRPSQQRRAWSPHAALALIDLVTERPLRAKIAHINRKEGILKLLLTDRSDGKEVHIGHQLISSGYAETACQQDSSKYLQHRPRMSASVYEFPLFRSVEDANLPTLEELLNDKGLRLEPEYRADLPEFSELPCTSAKKPSATYALPSTSYEGPSTSDAGPSTSIAWRSTSDAWSSPCKLWPSTSDAPPSTSVAMPSTSSATADNPSISQQDNK